MSPEASEGSRVSVQREKAREKLSCGAEEGSGGRSGRRRWEVLHQHRPGRRHTEKRARDLQARPWRSPQGHNERTLAACGEGGRKPSCPAEKAHPGEWSDNRQQQRWPSQSGEGWAVSTAEGRVWARESRTGLERQDEEIWEQERKQSGEPDPGAPEGLVC